MANKYKDLCDRLKSTDFSTNKYFQSDENMFMKVIQCMVSFSLLRQALSKMRSDIGLLAWMNEQIPALHNEKFNLCTKVYWMINNMSDFPVCSNEKCNTKIERNVSNIYNGYKVNSNFTYCCHKCAVSSEANKKLHEKTCLERYGVTSYTKTHECKQKIVSTSLKNYGTTNPGCSVQALEKIRQTNLRKRGVPCSFQSEEVKQKSKASFIRHYGVDNNMKSKEGLKAYQDAMQKKYGEGIISNFQLESTKEKSRKTKLRRHGDENYVNVDKMKQTKLERHGDPDYNNQEKFVKTMNERYGVDSPQQCPSIRAKSGYRYVYNGVRFDSGPEIAYYIWLSDNNIEFTYQPEVSFKYLDENGKDHLYIPDFQVSQELIEIKGDQYLDESSGKWICPYDRSRDSQYEAKHQCALQHNVHIMYSSEYKKYLDYVDQTYGKSYLKQFKRKSEGESGVQESR